MMASPSIKTTCEECVFATYSGQTQVGCRLGRLDKFKELGVPVETKETEDGRTVHLIGRICMAARKKPWGEELSPQQQEAKVREEMSFCCHAYIPALDATPEAIEKTLESLVSQKPRPVEAEVLIQGRTRPGPLIMRLNERFGERLNWKLTVINTDETTRQQAIDSAVARCRTPFYCVFNAGTEAPADFFSLLDEAINEELMTFSMKTGDEDDNGLVVVTQMHKHLGGNEVVDMVEGDPEEMTEEELAAAPTTPVTGLVNKVRFLAEVCGVEGLILEDKDLCQTAS